MSGPLTELDRARNELQATYPHWQIWYIPGGLTGITWHARPEPLLSAESPDALRAAIEAADQKGGAGQ